MTRFVKLTTSEYRNYGDMSFEEGRIARKLAQVARQQKETDGQNDNSNGDGNSDPVPFCDGNVHSRQADQAIDVMLFLSLWISKHEGRESWLNWLRFQTAEPADDERERGEYLADWFDELEVG